MSANVLVVDDLPLTRIMLMESLSKEGYTVLEAEDGQQALEIFSKHHPDLILMDADMPVLDGISACAEIKTQYPQDNTPVIMVTGHNDVNLVDRAFEAGAVDYVTKPINWDILRNQISYILKLKQAEEDLVKEKEKAQVTLDSIGDGVITTNAQGKIEYLNPAAEELTGWLYQQAKGLQLQTVFRVLNERDRQWMDDLFKQCLQKGQVGHLDEHAILVRKDSSEINIKNTTTIIRNNNKVAGIVVVLHDVTQERKLAKQIIFHASHDALTGLINRREFEQRLEQALYLSKQNTTEHAVLFMDLDRFKIVNDSCGHLAGDQLLRQVTSLFRRKVRKEDTIARLGGDEFAVLLMNCSLRGAIQVADNLRELVEEFLFVWENRSFQIGVSIGLTLIDQYSPQKVSDIINQADTACYAAKNAGRNCVQVYQEQSETTTSESVDKTFITQIKNALENNILELNYQRVVPIKETENRGVFYEILLRMPDNHGQYISPSSFLAIAERQNLLVDIEKWVIKTVFHHLTQDSSLDQLYSCSINLSEHSITPEFAQFILEQLEHYDIPTNKVCFELAETTVVTDLENTTRFLEILKQEGFLFALDDFGTGLASFAYLKYLPFDFLKIDGAFIKNIDTDPIDYAMVESIFKISQFMGIDVVAKLVERQSVLNKLQNIGINYAQGFLFAKPEKLL